MPNRSVRAVARLMWLAPLLLVLYSLYLFKAPFDYRRTLSEGIEAEAEIVELHLDNRVDVSMDYVTLAVTLPSGERLVQERVPLPHSLAPALEGRETVPARVLPGSPKPIVIVSDGGNLAMGRALWRLSVINGVICLVTALLFGGAILLWNRYLARHGDPADRRVEAVQIAPLP